VECCGLDSCSSGQGQGAVCSGQGNEPSGSIRGEEFVGKPSDCQLVKTKSDTWD
jgi:hypothetical protein